MDIPPKPPDKRSLISRLLILRRVRMAKGTTKWVKKSIVITF
jgi:hypothetical protein